MRITHQDRLEIRIFPDRDELGKTAAADVAGVMRQLLTQKEEISVIFASAPSQNEFLRYLGEQSLPWERITAFNMDEYVGIDPQAPQGFGEFLQRSLYSRVNLKQVHLFDCQSEDPQQECLRYGSLLEVADPDICIYGIGENGHLAFNDPPVADFQDPKTVKIVELDPVCRQQQVNDGCFATLEEVPHFAYTLTIPTLLKARWMFGMVPGPTKIEAVDRAVNGPVSTQCPASILRSHPRAVLYLDEVSAQKVR